MKSDRCGPWFGEIWPNVEHNFKTNWSIWALVWSRLAKICPKSTNADRNRHKSGPIWPRFYRNGRRGSDPRHFRPKNRSARARPKRTDRGHVWRPDAERTLKCWSAQTRAEGVPKSPDSFKENLFLPLAVPTLFPQTFNLDLDAKHFQNHVASNARQATSNSGRG